MTSADLESFQLRSKQMPHYDIVIRNTYGSGWILWTRVRGEDDRDAKIAWLAARGIKASAVYTGGSRRPDHDE